MRILGRVLVILAAALVVAGVVWALAGAGASGAMPAGAGPGGMEQHGTQGASVFGALEVLKNLVVIGVIIAITSLVSRVKPGRRAAAA